MGAPYSHARPPGTGSIYRRRGHWEARGPRLGVKDGPLVGRFAFRRDAERALEKLYGGRGKSPQP